MYPELKSDPVASVALIENRVQINCSILPDQTTEDVRHNIIFYEGAVKRKLYTKVLKGNQREATITNSMNGVSFQLSNEVQTLITY